MQRFLTHHQSEHTSSESFNSPPSTENMPILMDDDAPHNESATPTSTPTPIPSAGTLFSITWTALRHGGQLLTGAHYRPCHKHVIGTKIKPFWVFNHGADLEHEGKYYSSLPGSSTIVLILSIKVDATGYARFVIYQSNTCISYLLLAGLLIYMST